MTRTFRTKIASAALALAATLGVLAGASVTSTEMAQKSQGEPKSSEVSPSEGETAPDAGTQSYRWR